MISQQNYGVAMNYLRNSISNGSELEQALIRRWWHEEHESRGRIVWEYYLDWWYADAILFYNEKTKAVEETGQKARERFPLNGSEIILCEAKQTLSPSLIGQALVHAALARQFGARVIETIVLAERAPNESIKKIATDFGLKVVVKPL